MKFINMTKLSLRNWKVPAATALVGLAVGFFIGARSYQPQEVVESYKPTQTLSNNVVAVERKPELPPPEPIKQATKELKGELVRMGNIVIEPTKPLINIDWGLVSQKDGQRFILHTDDGEVIGGFDSPLIPFKHYPQRKWEVGVLVPIENPKGLGPMVSRKLGRLEIGVAGAKLPKEGWTTFATASFSW